ncbi:MAG TPA: hypothetical protein VGJ23_06530 [Gaiellaceae bacterium]
MRRPRLGPTLAALALTLLAAGLAVSVPRASATDPFPTTGIATLSSDHFTVHYSRDDADSTCSNFITQEKAGDVLGMLERVYSLYTSAPPNGWGYPAPVDDGDSHVDISVDDFVEACIPYGSIPVGTPGPLSRWDALVAPIGSGADDIHLDATKGLNYHVIAHELFHLIQDSITGGAAVDQWLAEGTAEWAAVRADAALAGEEQNPDRTMDCVGSECGDTEFDKNGYPGWMLFQYLAEQYGDGKVKDVWTEAAANPGALGTTDLANILPISLATFFNDYTTARLTGNFKLALLAGSLPASYATAQVGDSTSSLLGTYAAVNHLAVRYIALKHGVDQGAPCYAATLTINVAIPPSVTSYPYYYANTNGASAQALSVSGSNASITVPWNTCAGSPDAYLSLPNDTLDKDGREFLVTGTVTVDKTKPASASEPPPPRSIIGSVIPAPTSDPAPSLKVYAPEVIRVSAKTRLLRFAVFASGDGTLQAALGSAGLGSAALRSGNNDIRFVLPKQLFAKLRAKSASNLLELTSLSPSGSKGATVTRHVVLLAAKKPKRRR